jgi:hypothetical protein
VRVIAIARRSANVRDNVRFIWVPPMMYCKKIEKSSKKWKLLVNSEKFRGCSAQKIAEIENIT